LNNKSGSQPPAMAQGLRRVSIEDVIILPLVVFALASKNLFKATLSILIRILDSAFPILLQVARLPLFIARIVGDGATALLIGIVGCLPVSRATHEAWRNVVARNWSWLRQKISYRAFEEFVHDAFERGMAWVFRKCRALTPSHALWVLAGAVLWLPISFGAATGMHAVLIAKAASLPAWMQLLHPVATVIAKSKLLVLPVFPAAWPRAREHPFVQAISRLYRYVGQVRLVQKTRYRYRQTESASAEASEALRRAVVSVGFRPAFTNLFAGLDASAGTIRKAWQATVIRTVAGLRRMPLIGSIISRCAVRYGGKSQQDAARFSQKAKSFFERWSIKFSAEYYEARDKDEAARRRVGS
jgi:hypothetical protein